MEPEHRDDWGDDMRRRLDEAKAMAQDRKEEFQESDAYRGWKSWTPARRFFTVGLAIIALAVLIGLVSQLGGIPLIPGPRGE
jgi:hypothetical protein